MVRFYHYRERKEICQNREEERIPSFCEEKIEEPMKEEKERGPEPIEVWGAGENNLKQASVKIPKNQVVVFTGVSVSGKSSLVFDTLAVESNREWQVLGKRHSSPKNLPLDFRK